ncbi:ABC transporter ATP-binding protein [Paenibacillus sp. UNC451MF]|uniref:ABC transporter ATP-binding protein n=1 Tax=Paenibacillus sp. UNC451MF TaxID=1449063 RepID=UPI00048B8D17|nr:ABC transporter ATP-binding protein [Paenibacillus sp. UNC451MF]
MPILDVRDLSISFTQYTGGLKQNTTQVIHDLHLAIHSGEIVAVVGSSGSGKSLLAHAILGILPSNAKMTGKIQYDGQELDAKRMAALRGKEIALVPQSVTFLDPLMRVGEQVKASVREGDSKAKLKEVFERYRLAPDTDKKYPFQLSGGMARRVLVSTATISGAKLIIADEPTPGLDPAVVQEALGRFRELADNGAGVMLITHDIESALAIADRVAVFYAGTTVEVSRAEDFRSSGDALRHPYSKALWRALPQNDFAPIPGFQPHPNALPPGCLFAPRCALATPECSEAMPAERELRGGMVRCIHAS